MTLGKGKGKNWRSLGLDERLREGDRRMYPDLSISPRPVLKDELHLVVGQTGYFGVVRRWNPDVTRRRKT